MVVDRFPALSERFIAHKFLHLLGRGWDVHLVGRSGETSAWREFPELAGRAVRARVHLTPPPSQRTFAAKLEVAGRTALVSPAGTARFLRHHMTRPKPARRGVLPTQLRILSLEPDLVHYEFGWLAREHLPPAQARRCKVLTSFRGSDIAYHGLEDPHFYDEVWHASDGYHFLGGDLRRRALGRGCPEGAPHALIPAAVDYDYFRPAQRAPEGDSKDPLRVASVGRLHWKKGYEHNLAAIAALRAGSIDVEYRIAGTGPHRDAVVSCIEQLGLDGAVRLVGALPRDEIRSLLAWADVFLHGAISEGFCNAVLEAQAMEVPVVCSDADGLGENVEDGTSGFVVPRYDGAGLADKMAELARDPYRAVAMGRAGRRRVVERFGVEGQIDAFEELYRSLLS